MHSERTVDALRQWREIKIFPKLDFNTHIHINPRLESFFFISRDREMIQHVCHACLFDSSKSMTSMDLITIRKHQFNRKNKNKHY